MMWLCASFMLLAPAASAVISAEPISTSGNRVSSSLPMARKLTSICRPMPLTRLAVSLNDSRISSIDSRPSSTAASILPPTSAARGTGVASSGSSDCRSRSPAVVSIARWAPPMKAKMVRISGSSIAMNELRLASAVARSRVPTLSGAAMPGSMPRTSRRRLPTALP